MNQLRLTYFTGGADVATTAPDDAPVDVLHTLLMSLLFIGRVDLVELLNAMQITALEANVDAVVENGAPVDAVSASPSAPASLFLGIIQPLLWQFTQEEILITLTPDMGTRPTQSSVLTHKFSSSS